MSRRGNSTCTYLGFTEASSASETRLASAAGAVEPTDCAWNLGKLALKSLNKSLVSLVDARLREQSVLRVRE